jgi:hypothetical protein
VQRFQPEKLVASPRLGAQIPPVAGGKARGAPMGWAPLQASPLTPLETEQIIRVIRRAAIRLRSIGENTGRERVVTALERLHRLREGVALS